MRGRGELIVRGSTRRFSSLETALALARETIMEAAPLRNKEGREQALANMECALQILDQFDAPADIGAHLDLAISRLIGSLGQDVDRSTPQATLQARS